MDEGHHDGDRGGGALRGDRLQGRGRDHDIHLRLHEIGDEVPHAVAVALGGGEPGHEVAALNIIQLTHRLDKGRPQPALRRLRPERDVADLIHLPRLLRLGHEGGRQRREAQRVEKGPAVRHSMT